MAARLDKIGMPIQDVKWQKALNGDYILFYSTKEAGENAGLYYARIDFTQVGRETPEKLLDLISENKKLVEDLKKPKEVQKWGVAGNEHVLAVAYSVLEAEKKTTSKLMILTSQDGSFVECVNFDHSGNKVNAIEVIVPNPESDIAHVIFGLSGGMDTKGH